MWGQGRAARSPAGQLAVWSAYLNFFSSERASRRLCSSKELTSQRFTWDKLKTAKLIPEDCRLHNLKGHPSHRDGGGEQEGKGPPKSSQWGSLPYSILAKCDSLVHREAKMLGAWHCPRLCSSPSRPGQALTRGRSGHWVAQRTQSPRRCFRVRT